MFDLLTLLLAIALAFTALGVIGVIQYNVQMNNMPEGLTDYEIRESLGYFARSRGSFLTYGLSQMCIRDRGFEFGSFLFQKTQFTQLYGLNFCEAILGTICTWEHVNRFFGHF